MSKIALLLTPGFADWEYAYIAGIGGPFYGLDVQFFALEPGDLTSQGGLAAHVTAAASEIEAFAPNVLAVIGGMIWDSAAAPDVSAPLKAQIAAGGTVAGICGGTLALARAGLLDEVAHTSNAADLLAEGVPAYAGAAHYVDSPRAIVAGQIITAPGTAAGSFAACIFTAAGLDADTTDQFRAMLAAEHTAA
ncbi:MAG: DJ-1/PfpI family protein [Pseudomonadota bacterium]